MEELLTCSVCCERYSEEERQPVVLPRCGHSFCRPCVTLLLTASCIICPTCRTDQRIESAHRLPTEYTLLAIITAQENAKLDNCRRHDVKLSFWCKTCSIATCGECLFEDHPTHSHDVIRSLTYIKNIKESVQEIGCKFMEALDTREQTYYKTVYTSAKEIDDALRNVIVLRKDMGEARSLMNGVKVDETNMTLSTATTLAEAAKYLGLKWNIQDANFNREQREKQDKVEAEKQEEQEKQKKEEEESKRELTAEEEKERRKERIRERKRKRLLAEKKEKEAAAAAASAANGSPVEEKTAPEASPAESAAPVSADAESLTSKDNKKKPLSIRKSKTMAVFEPLSMDKEITDIKEKIVQLDNKERERLENEAIKEKEEEEQEEREKKVLEEKAIEADKEAEALLEAIRVRVAEKEKELQLQADKEARQFRKRSEEQEAAKKAAEEELDKLNQILKKPKGKLTRSYLLDIEKEDSESAKLLSDFKNSLMLNGNQKLEEGEEEKTNGEPEHADKVEGEEQQATAAPAEGMEEATFAGEMSPEEKEAKQREELEQKEGEAGKLFEFMKEPLFSVCVEGCEGRLALAQWEPKGIHVYCHQFQQLHYDIAIRSNVLQALIPSKNPIVFLELTVGTARPTRIYVKLWGHLRRAHNFLALCIGDQGPALLNTKLLQVYNLNEPGERILGGDHEYNCGRGGCGLLNDLEWNGDYSMPMQDGLLTAAGSGQHATNSLFLICTRGDLGRNFSCPFGEVVEGLEDVRDAIAKSAAEELEIWVTECGVLLEPPRV